MLRFLEHSSNVTLNPMRQVPLVTVNYIKSRSLLEAGFSPVGDDMYLEHIGDGEDTSAWRTWEYDLVISLKKKK